MASAQATDIADQAYAAGQEQQSHLTKRVLFVLCAINLIDCINSTILVPYVDAMVSSILHKPRGDPSVSLWVSVLVGSYSICEVLFSGFWGMLSDRIGRRPVLLIGLAGSAVAPIIFGLAQSLPVALFARLLDGFFCGNAGITRTYLGEVVDKSNEAKAFGYLSLTFSIGLIIGPLLGGLISNPAATLPQVFEGTIFETFPFFLPNLTYAIFAVLSFIIGACSLKETRAASKERNDTRSVLLSSDSGHQPRSGRWSPRLLYAMVAMAILSGYTAARLQAYILVASLPRKLNGLAFGPEDFGLIQVCAAAWILFAQLCLYERGMKRFGPYRCFIAGMSFTTVLMAFFPAYCLVADPDRFGFWRYVPVGLWQGISQIGFSMSFPTSYLLLNRECHSHNRGAINGWANSFSALSRGVSPLIAGALVKWGTSIEKPGIPGGRYIAFYVTCFVGVVNILVLLRYSRAQDITTSDSQGLDNRSQESTPCDSQELNC